MLASARGVFTRATRGCSAWKAPGKWLLPLAAVVLGVGCGHEATREECEIILAKNAEFELRAQGITDPAVIERRVDETKAAKPELLETCIGKRITEDAMRCVRDAPDAEAFEACLD